MHNGSLKTLNEVIRHYEDGFVKRPSLSPLMLTVSLTAEERQDLIAFLGSLSSKDPLPVVPILPINKGN